MDKKLITDNIRRKLGIERLNDMQQQLLAFNEPTALLIAPTGSGKTLAFASNMLSAMTSPSGSVQALILAPSRELAMQINEVVRPIATGYKTTVLYGGHSMLDETKSLTPAPDIIIATPGRLLDHIQRHNIDISGVKILIIDEYDKCLELGFSDEMQRIVKRIKSPQRIILTSATRLEELPSYLPVRNPVTIMAQTTTHPAKRTQVVEVVSPAKDKADTLVELLRSLPNGKVIVFVNHRESAERVFNILKRNHLPAGLYHGGLEQLDRDTAITLLNNDTTPILVSTDLGSRGIDIDDVSEVIHYHLPPSAESWTHRNGRTARMGATGTVYVLTAEGENIPEYMTFDRSYVPTGISTNPITAGTETIYINAGKKEKISKGDIAGYIMAHTQLESQQVGPITIRDHASLVAVPAGKAAITIDACSPHKLKGKKVRLSVKR